MRSITWYMTKQVLAVTVFVSIALVFAIWLTQSLRLVDMILNRGLPLGVFLHLAVLLMPSFLNIVVPIAVFCAALFTYNKLIQDSEIIVLRAAGLTPWTLAKPALIVGLGATALMMLLNLYLLPASFRTFKDLEFRIRNDFSTVLIQEGVFNTVSDGVTVFVRDRTSDGELLGILLHDNRNIDKPITLLAERGALVTTETGPRVILVKGNRQQIDHNSGQLSLLYFDRYTVEVDQIDESQQGRWREPDERFLHELFNPGPDTADSYRQDLVAEAHERLATPLLPLAYVAIAIAILLTGPFNRRGQIKMILLSVVVVTGVLVLSLTLRNMGGKNPALLPLLYANSAIPLLIALTVLLVPHRLRRKRLPTPQDAATGG